MVGNVAVDNNSL